MLRNSPPHFGALLRAERYYFGSSDSGGGDQDITSRVEPWDGAKPYFADLYAQAEIAFFNTSREPYAGQFFAGGNSYDFLSRTALDEAAAEMSLDADRLRSHADVLMSGYYLSPETNPFLAGTVNASLDTVTQSFTNEVLPAIIDSSIRAGAYAGTPQSEITLRAIERYSIEANKVSAAVYYENYQRERVVMEASPNLVSAAQTIEAKKAQLLQANADLLRAVTQIELDEAIRHYEDSLVAPWRGFQEYVGVLTGGGFSSTEQDNPEASAVGSILSGTVGGAATGWALGSSIGSIGGPMGAAIGGLLGGIGSIF